MKTFQLTAFAAIALLAACSHNGARSFSMNSGSPPPTTTDEEPAPTPPPEPQPAPPAPPSGTLTRTTDAANTIVGGALHITGNTLLGLGNRTDLPNNLPVIGNTLGGVVNTVDGHLNTAAQVQVVGLPVLGASQPSGNQAIGVGVLSQTPPTGTVASVGVLNQGAQQQPLNVNIGGAQILGNSGPATINVGVLNNPSAPANPPPGRSPGGLLGNVVTTITAPVTVPPGGR